jgi:hypothetical protein
MANVTGPRGQLFEDIDARLKEPRRKKASPSKRTPSVRMNKHEKFLAKDAKDYNGNDLEFLIRDEWEKKEWNTRPSSFTMKDRVNAKRLIEDQGGKNVVAMIKYVFQDWNRIQSQYSIRGLPSMSLFYGFRGSWLPEALDGMQAPKKKFHGEYVEREEAPLEEEDASLNIKLPWHNKGKIDIGD